MSNLSPVHSYEGYGIRVPRGSYKIVLNSDDRAYGGFGRVDSSFLYPTEEIEGCNTDDGQLMLYLPHRTALVLKKVS